MKTTAPVYHLFSAASLHDFTTRVFQYHGVPEADARLAANVLAYSDLHGIDSHGVARLKTYSDLLQTGRINPRPLPRIIRERKATATFDGDNGLGLVVGPMALEIAMDKAAECGTGSVAVCNTNHFGAAGYYPVEALKRDQIGWAMTNSSKGVAPLWGAEKMLGTNPIAMAFPGLEEPPVVVDLATSAVAYGKIEIAGRKGESIPDGWAIAQNGLTTLNPLEMMNGGALLPLGSTREMGGHKGYCLAALVDMLTAVLSGANWGPFAPAFAINTEVTPGSVGKGIGHFFGAWDIDAFREVDEFKRQVDHWVRTFRQTKVQPGQERVLIPGDPERAAFAIRSEKGIPVIEAVVADLQGIAARTGLKLGD